MGLDLSRWPQKFRPPLLAVRWAAPSAPQSITYALNLKGHQYSDRASVSFILLPSSF
jgi:hypothetical protein